MHDLLKISNRVLRAVDLTFRRYLYDNIDYDSRLIIIKGARGVGKTTLLQQYIKAECAPNQSIWISLDHIYFSAHALISTIDELYNAGYRVFALDEVHKYPNWSLETKNIYDSYPDIQLLLTSSSALDVMSGMADLSRRADVYQLEGLSFREYMLLDNDISLSKYSFDDILADHISIAEEITATIDIPKYFNNFVKTGSYPFFKESKRRYPDKVKSIVNQVIEVDLPSIFSIDYNSIRQLKKLLALLARLVPYSPDISQLSKDVGIGRNRILIFLDYLNSAGLIHLLKSNKKSDSIMAKPDKIFLNNTNLIHALGMGIANAGTIRETFVMNALSATEQVSTPIKGDFMINNAYIAEVGGKNKTFKQITGLPNSFLIKEGITIGSQDVIPMWVLGLMY